MHKLVIFTLILLLALTGCTTPVSPTPTLLPTNAAVTQQPATATIIPATTTPPASRVVLVDASAPASAQLKAALKELAATQAWQFEERPGLSSPLDLNAAIKVVVLTAEPANLDALLAAAPQTQFVLLGGKHMAGGNLSTLRTDPLQTAFLAGYIATIMGDNWRSSGIVPAEPVGLAEAFQNGGRYWCGRCIPLFAPVVTFPLVTALPSNASPADVFVVVNQFQKNLPDTLYIAKEFVFAETYKDVSGRKLILLGADMSSGSMQGRWAVNLRGDTAAGVKALWPTLIAGKGGQAAIAPLMLTDINEQLLSPGKQRLVQDVLLGLQNGSIAPLTPPAK